MYAKQSAKFAVPVLVTALLVSANVYAQGAPQSSPQQPSGVRVDPSAGPLNPSESAPQSAAPQPTAPQDTTPPNGTSTLPNAPQPQAAPPAQRQEQPPAEEPLGAAAAEQVRTAGGGASRPAGNAIAPAKQHQYRSLLIKLGAVAAAGVAVGTVYGLSHATPSTPPHTATAATK